MSRLVHMGIDDRAAFKGAHRNDFTSNINAFSLKDRLEDEHYYRNMPMTGPATDPVNTQGDDKKKQSLRNTLLARIQDILPASAAIMAPPVPAPIIESEHVPVYAAAATEPVPPKIDPAAVLKRTAASWRGLYADACAWDHIPAPDAGQKLRYVLTRNDRFPYILAMVVLVMFFVILGHVLW
jgi:hypothetical protein